MPYNTLDIFGPPCHSGWKRRACPCANWSSPMPRSCTWPSSRRSPARRSRATTTACTGSCWSARASVVTRRPSGSARTPARWRAGSTASRPGASPASRRASAPVGRPASRPGRWSRWTGRSGNRRGAWGTPRPFWDGKLLAHHVAQRYGVPLGVRQCQRLFHHLGFRRRKPRPVIAQADPAAQAAFKKTPAPRRRPRRGSLESG